MEGNMIPHHSDFHKHTSVLLPQVHVSSGSCMWVNTAKLPGLTYTVKIHCVLMSYSLSIWLNDTVMIDNRPKASFYQNWWLFSLTIKLHIIWQGWVTHVPDLVISNLSRQTWKGQVLTNQETQNIWVNSTYSSPGKIKLVAGQHYQPNDSWCPDPKPHICAWTCCRNLASSISPVQLRGWKWVWWQFW